MKFEKDGFKEKLNDIKEYTGVVEKVKKRQECHSVPRFGGMTQKWDFLDSPLYVCGYSIGYKYIIPKGT